MKNLTLAGAVSITAAALVACGPPVNNTPVEGVPNLKTLEAVMDAQATTADPQFAKMEQASFTDAELASLGETGRKIEATAKRTKDFTMGPDFDAFATKLGEGAVALSKAAAAKDAAAVRAALGAMKGTCKECHSKFR